MPWSPWREQIADGDILTQVPGREPESYGDDPEASPTAVSQGHGAPETLGGPSIRRWAEAGKSGCQQQREGSFTILALSQREATPLLGGGQ